MDAATSHITTSAKSAFQTYSRIVKRQIAEPDRWNDEDRIAERLSAYEHFLRLFAEAL
jgi:hypothetical protein